jgi:hypothetical protein
MVRAELVDPYAHHFGEPIAPIATLRTFSPCDTSTVPTVDGRSQLDVMCPRSQRHDDTRLSSDRSERLLIDEHFDSKCCIEHSVSDEGQRSHPGRR